MKSLICLVLLPFSVAFVTNGRQDLVVHNEIDVHLHASSLSSSLDDDVDQADRRNFLSLVPATAATYSLLSQPAIADTSKPKVVVLGGSGWVGAHVNQLLVEKGYDVVSVSRSTPADQAKKVKAILGVDLPITYKSLDASKDDLTDVLKGSKSVISCVGVVPGAPNQRDGNGAVNVRIADAAKASGIDTFVYISVASEVAKGPAKFLFGDYVKGKGEAEAAVLKDYGSSSLIIKPGIIAGAPPGELRPPGPPGITPVSAEAVARVVVAGALGNMKGTIDGNAAISAAASS